MPRAKVQNNIKNVNYNVGDWKVNFYWPDKSKQTVSLKFKHRFLVVEDQNHYTCLIRKAKKVIKDKLDLLSLKNMVIIEVPYVLSEGRLSNIAVDLYLQYPGEDFIKDFEYHSMLLLMIQDIIDECLIEF